MVYDMLFFIVSDGLQRNKPVFYIRFEMVIINGQDQYILSLIYTRNLRSNVEFPY